MNWTEKCYSRMLVDNHISDISPEFMRNFDPRQYAAMMRLGGAESSMVYACDHNGNCYYPTQTGHMHRNLQGRDLFRETVDCLRRDGIVPIAYYTVIYHNDAAARFPRARVRDVNGKDHDGRYHYACPNHSETTEFFKRQIAEIIAYPVEGLFIDMTFWPAICCCDGCRRKFGRPLPRVIDWNNPEWIAFQRFREESMAEFAAELTAFAKKIRPELSVVHQFSPVLHGWLLGQSNGIAAASDYASGDFYGGKLQQRLAVKVFDSFSRTKPFEFMTSRCVDLHDHTSTKSDDELFFSALTTLANGGAYFFIDAIDPDGRLQEPFYRRLATIQQQLTPFREVLQHTRAELFAEVGLYFSIRNCVDDSLNGVALTELAEGKANNMAVRRNAVLDEILGSAELLNAIHVPWRIVPEGFQDLSGLKAIIINDAAFLSADECDRLREFVRNGGTLIATGRTSLREFDGSTSGNFALADLFGVDTDGTPSDSVTYFGEERILAHGYAPLSKARPETKVRALISMPYFPAGNAEKYSSIHSDPPGNPTGYAAVTVNNCAQGVCVYCATAFLKERHDTQRRYGKALFREFLPTLLADSDSLPDSLELTLLKGKKTKQWLLTLVNYQEELPAIPLHDVRLKLRLPFSPTLLHQVSTGKELPFRRDADTITLHLPRIARGEFLLFEEQTNSHLQQR